MKMYIRHFAILALGAVLTTNVVAADAETLPSGVKIVHTKAGTGTNPVATNSVKVHYRGHFEWALKLYLTK